MLLPTSWNTFRVSTNEISLDDVNCQAVEKLNKLMASLKKEMSAKSGTTKLWVQYMDYVTVMRQFIRAARAGDWNLQLITMEKMLNLFAGTGHMNYVKSSRLYLQSMLELPHTHPWMHKKLSIDGFHVIRRSERFWAGLWPDLVIELVIYILPMFCYPDSLLSVQ